MSTSTTGEKETPAEKYEWHVSIRSETADLVAASLFILVSIWYIVQAMGFPTRGSAWVQAHTFPIGIGALAIISAIVLALLAIRRILSRQRDEALTIHKPLTVLIGLLCTVAYATVLPWLGFYLTSAIFTTAFGYAAGIRKVWALAALTVGFLVFTKFIFDMALGTPLPTGTWL
ncbi:tripartite tricarboxylate transporter TctB family protein [Halomonas kalidii]|uniref:Tripartite tricarboxylate transporter TctB family protein n=1 Tax=Halomonas kalidii TaxID=3043293 RepID=A0ABT6VRA3_9GAMM|nr:tripartite tricarboxylate transporter TctB family protein [Halomonas kalidii]MDI5935301.1 tripartite tricarboxylate transporter TctB family protein [Halomonas kalidii]